MSRPSRCRTTRTWPPAVYLLTQLMYVCCQRGPIGVWLTDDGPVPGAYMLV